MAVRLDPRQYSAGAVDLDSNQPLNLYNQLIAKREALRKAKEDTFDEYIRGMNTKINAAGHRTVDNAAFQHSVDKWMRFNLGNKEKIMSNDIDARTEANRLYQEAMNITNESKDAEEEIKPVNVNMADPAKRSEYSSNVIPSMASHNGPIRIKDEKTGEYVIDKNRKKISDYGDSLFNPKLDFGKEFSESWSKGIAMGDEIGEVTGRDPITGRAITEHFKVFTPDGLKQISLNAGRSAEKGGKNNNYYQLRLEKFDEDPAKAAFLTEQFQSVHGKTVKLANGQTVPNEIDSPEELAAAEAIVQGRAMKQKSEKASNDQLADQAFRRSMINVNVSTGGGGNQSGMRDIYTEIVTKGASKTGGLIPMVDLSASAQSIVLKQARDLLSDNNISQSDIYIRTEGDRSYIMKVSAKGRAVSSDKVIGEMDFVGVNLPAQADVKGKRAVVAQGNNNTQPPKPKATKPKPY